MALDYNHPKENQMKHVILAAVVLLSAATPSMAQSAGDGSLVGLCRSRTEQLQVAVEGERDPGKRAAAASELKTAENALASGNSTLCSIDADRTESALR
jgi:hypothetical protein